MSTLFIADLHLDDSRPHITSLFETFLASDEVRNADALYILGDLVEAWIGDDDDAELPQRIARATRAAHGDTPGAVIDTDFPPESKFDQLPEEAAPQGRKADTAPIPGKQLGLEFMFQRADLPA